MINKTRSVAFALMMALLCQIQASEIGSTQRSPFAVYRPTRKPTYTWMKPHIMIEKPRDYWRYVSEGRVNNAFDYGLAKKGDSGVREPVNAMTYGSSYANSGYKGA